MRASNLQGLLTIASCVVLLAPPLAACSGDDSSTAGTIGGGDGGAFDLGPPILLSQCHTRGGFVVFDESGGSLPEMTRCPAGTHPIASIEDDGSFGLCCFIEYERCKPQQVQVGSTCDTDIAYYFLGRGCAPIRDCACIGPDCGEGYATEDECTDAHEGCELGVGRCGTLGDTCVPSQYCAEPSCSATSSGGLCVPIPTACEDALEPVCGCDGVTYDNECELAKATKSLRSLGACDAPADP